MKNKTELRDAQTAFEEAIKAGYLEAHPGFDLFAGNWMYMYSMNHCDYFKHFDTREYLEVPQGQKAVA